jgi:hypothetical protein
MQPQRVWRMEARPGEEVQVDFGLGAPIEDGASRSRRSWVFRMVLSYSRKAYSEAVLRQDTETFLRLCKTGGDLLTRGPVDPFVSNPAFPLLEKEVFFAQ